MYMTISLWELTDVNRNFPVEDGPFLVDIPEVSGQKNDVSS